MQRISNARHAVLAIFFINGFILASWVPHIPLVKERLGLGEAALGLALLAMAAGAVATMPLSGLWSNRQGSGRVTAWAAFCFSLALPLPTLAPGLASLMAALAVFGACNGAMDVAMNAQAVAVEKHHGSPLMSSFHGFFSLGGLAGSGTGALALGLGMPPAVHVGAVCAIALPVCLIACKHLLPSQADIRSTGPKFVLPKGSLLGLGALAFLVLAAEGAMMDWSAVYMRSVLFSEQGVAATGYAAFSLAMAAGRLFGDRFVAQAGPVRLTRITALLAACGLWLALAVTHSAIALVGFACVGLGMSNLIPVLFSAAGSHSESGAGPGIAAVATAGYFGLLAGPPTIGFLAEYLGLPVALGCIGGGIAVVALLAGLTKSPDMASNGGEQATPEVVAED
ncbi:MAG: MFS transporter [Desulfovibrio sp.]|uniref:MFS transporter n=1 Tax=Desulfovibrio sp. 7SRBS1 TaxID=3378064 RepID=UPI003B40A9B4